jgi:hypothetical protein
MARIDRIAEPWGTRTPYGAGETWPTRVNPYLTDGLTEDDVDRWVQSATILHSNGDGLDIAVKDGRIVGVRGRAVDRVNHGRLGPKDLFGWQANNSPDRLSRPLIRRDGELVETDWDTAMEAVVGRCRELLDEQGPSAIGFYTTGQLFIADYYTLGLIAHGGIGTNHVDGNTRLCTATAAAALKESFACDGSRVPTPSRGSDRDRDPHAAAGLRAVALDLPLEVQWSGDRGALGDLGGDQVGRQQPGDLELDAVGVLGVERLGGHVVGGTDQRAGPQQRLADAGELGERVHLPRQVVQPDGPAARLGRAGTGADLEQAQVVVVRGALGLQEDRGARDLHPGAEAEDVPVEGVAALDVADVEDGVVEALDGHGGLLMTGRPVHPAPTYLSLQAFLRGQPGTAPA